MPLREVRDEAELRAAMASPEFLLFKHSLICPVSARAFREYAAFVDGGAGVPTAWVDVIGQRPLSRAVETDTGVAHESPQALLFRGGSVVWSASHGGITRKTLASALAAARAG